MHAFLALALGLCALARAADVTLINTAEDFKQLGGATEGFFVLNADITLEDWTPLYGFQATLDGADHTITVKSLKPAPDDGALGIFYVLSKAIIRDLIVVMDDVKVVGADFGTAKITDLHMGGLASRLIGCTFSGLNFSGSLSVSLSFATPEGLTGIKLGGIAGACDAISGINSSMSVVFSGPKLDVPVYVGGIAGRITGDGTYVATTGVNVTAENIVCESGVCYAGGLTGKIETAIVMGALVNVENIVANGTDTSGTHFAAGLSPIITSQIEQTGGSPLHVESRVQLSRVAATTISSTYFAGGFSGNVDGASINHCVAKVTTVEGLFIAAGGFNKLNDNAAAELTMIQIGRIATPSVQEYVATGDLANRNISGFANQVLNGTLIQNCLATVMMIDAGSSFTGGFHKGAVGGFVGYMRSSHIHNSYSYVQRFALDEVEGTNDKGRTQTPMLSLGGFIGNMEYLNNDNKQTVSTDSCFALVGSMNLNVIAGSGRTRIGGFAGSVSGSSSASYDDRISIQNCYSSFSATMAATGTQDSTFYFGGFIGGIFNDASVMNCYSIGSVRTQTYGPSHDLLGQFVGANGADGMGRSLRIVDCMSFVGFRDSITNADLGRGFFGYYLKLDNTTGDVRGNYMVNTTEDACQYRQDTPEAVLCVSPDDVRKLSSYPLRRFGAAYAWSMTEGTMPRLTTVPNPTNMFYQLTTRPAMVAPVCSAGRCFDFSRVWDTDLSVLPILRYDTFCLPDCVNQPGAGKTYYKDMRTCTCVEGCPDVFNGYCVDDQGHALCEPGYGEHPLLPAFFGDTCSYYSCSSDNSGNACNYASTGATCNSNLDVCACPDHTQFYNYETQQCESGCENGVYFGICIGVNQAICTEARFEPMDSDDEPLCSHGDCYLPDPNGGDDPISACGTAICNWVTGGCLCPDQEKYWDPISRTCQLGCPGLMRGYCLGPNHYHCEDGYYTAEGDEYLCFSYDCRKDTDEYYVCGGEGVGKCDQDTGKCTCAAGTIKHGGSCSDDMDLCPRFGGTLVDGVCQCGQGWHTENPLEGYCMVQDCIRYDTPNPIYDEDGLREMLACPDLDYILEEDIVLSEPWDGVVDFSGTLDGNGHTISNISFWPSEDTHSGFIKTLRGGSLVALHLDLAADIETSTPLIIGAVGEVQYGSISGLYVTGRINVTFTDASGFATVGCVAGIGRNMSSTIGECSLTCVATNGGSCMVGGLAAVNRVGSTLTHFVRSYSDIVCESKAKSCVVGGIFAQSYNPLEGGYFAGSISAKGETITEAGGVCAHCESSMRATFARVHSLSAISSGMVFASGFAATARYLTIDLCSAVVDTAEVISRSRGGYGGIFAESALGGLEIQNSYGQTHDLYFSSDAWQPEDDSYDSFGACLGGMGGHLSDANAQSTVIINSYGYLGTVAVDLSNTNTRPDATYNPECFIGGFVGVLDRAVSRVVSGNFGFIANLVLNTDQQVSLGGFGGEVMTGNCALANCWSIIQHAEVISSHEDSIVGIGSFLGVVSGSTVLRNDYGIATEISLDVPDTTDLTGRLGTLLARTANGNGRDISLCIADAAFTSNSVEIKNVDFMANTTLLKSNYMRCDRSGVKTASDNETKYICTTDATAFKRSTYPALDFTVRWATPGDAEDSAPYLRTLPNPGASLLDDPLNPPDVVILAAFDTSNIETSLTPSDPLTPWDYVNHWSTAMFPGSLPSFIIQDGDCARIDPNCLECNEGKCTYCDHNMIVSENGFACLEPPCQVANCDACDPDNPNVCILCDTANGYKIMDYGARCALPDCKRNDRNCQTCEFANNNDNDDSVTCKTCVGGYTLADGTCFANDACKDVVTSCASCSTIDPRQCQFCIGGYELVDGSCIPACIAPTSSDYITNCAVCNTANTKLCSSCLSGYELASGNRECLPACIAPISPYYDPYCEVCKNSATTQCDRCTTGYVTDPANSNLCTATCRASVSAAPVEHCATCSASNPSQCATCEVGYYLNSAASSNGVCEGSCMSTNSSNSGRIPNCISCSGSNPYLCSQCSDGFFAATSGLTCVGVCVATSGTADAIANCVRCDEETGKTCVQCDPGYAPSSNGKSCRSNSMSSGLDGGAIAGIVIAVLIILGVAGFLVYWFVFRKGGAARSRKSRAVLPSAADNNSLMTESDSRMAAF